MSRVRSHSQTKVAFHNHDITLFRRIQPPLSRLSSADILRVEVEVEVEQPLKFLGLVHDSINALGPFGGELCTGFGVRIKTVNGPVVIFIDLGEARVYAGREKERDEG